jgi:hypothetical protein
LHSQLVQIWCNGHLEEDEPPSEGGVSIWNVR